MSRRGAGASVNLVGRGGAVSPPVLAIEEPGRGTSWVIRGPEFCLSYPCQHRTGFAAVRMPCVPTGVTAMSRLSSLSVRSVLLAMSLVLGTGCNSHPLLSPDAGPQIAKRGISVPVPPPSLKLMPVQRVDIEGELGMGAVEPDTRVFLNETRRGLPGQFVFPDGDSFFFEGVEVDLTNNCIEVWTEDAAAEASVHSFYVASIDADDQSVITEQLFNGCP